MRLCVHWKFLFSHLDPRRLMPALCDRSPSIWSHFATLTHNTTPDEKEIFALVFQRDIFIICAPPSPVFVGKFANELARRWGHVFMNSESRFSRGAVIYGPLAEWDFQISTSVRATTLCLTIWTWAFSPSLIFSRLATGNLETKIFHDSKSIKIALFDLWSAKISTRRLPSWGWNLKSLLYCWTNKSKKLRRVSRSTKMFREWCDESLVTSSFSWSTEALGIDKHCWSHHSVTQPPNLPLNSQESNNMTHKPN